MAISGDGDGGVPQLTVAAVARRLGVAPATLRTWDRRYGLGPSEHAAGAHRRYGTGDLARLLVMRRLTIDGVAPAQAAQIARTAEVGELFEPLPAENLVVADPVAVDALVDAALAADEEAVGRLVAIGPGGDVLAWWNSLVDPALAALSRRLVIDRPGTSPLMVLGEAALAEIRAAMPRPTGGRPVVLVLAPGMRIGIIQVHAIAGVLATRAVDARVVGGSLSPRHAVELVAMTQASVTITVVDSAHPDLAAVERVAAERPDLQQFVMLPDAALEYLPVGRNVHRARTITGVVHEVLAAVGLTGAGHSGASVRSIRLSHSG
jgi:DNA-binding transcriptional MerR regulator